MLKNIILILKVKKRFKAQSKIHSDLERIIQETNMHGMTSQKAGGNLLWKTSLMEWDPVTLKLKKKLNRWLKIKALTLINWDWKNSKNYTLKLMHNIILTKEIKLNKINTYKSIQKRKKLLSQNRLRKKFKLQN
jgi:hypothetical protein